ncbi:hypothetical protein OSCI_1480040 [Kamptonema sp. PCC 6506]|nr:hypothetical protein OSCI_1480040 [Kamptonema sp. PCC 6506]
MGEICLGGDTRPSIVNDLTVFGKRLGNLGLGIWDWEFGTGRCSELKLSGRW